MSTKRFVLNLMLAGCRICVTSVKPPGTLPFQYLLFCGGRMQMQTRQLHLLLFWHFTVLAFWCKLFRLLSYSLAISDREIFRPRDFPTTINSAALLWRRVFRPRVFSTARFSDREFSVCEKIKFSVFEKIHMRENKVRDFPRATTFQLR